MDKYKLCSSGIRLSRKLDDKYIASAFIQAFNLFREAYPKKDDFDIMICAACQVTGEEDVSTSDMGLLLNSMFVYDRLDVLAGDGILKKTDIGYIINPKLKSVLPECKQPGTVDLEGPEFIKLFCDIVSKDDSIIEDKIRLCLNAFRLLTPGNPFWPRWDEVTAVLDDNDEWKHFYKLCHQFLKMGPIPVTVNNNDGGFHCLIDKGLAVIIPRKDVDDDDDDYQRALLSDAVCMKLFRGIYRPPFVSSLSHSGSVVAPEDIAPKRLYYDKEVEQQLDELHYIMRKDVFAQVAERFKTKGRSSGVTCLLYGCPGSGKTELVRQLARESGRAVVMVDAARVSGRYMGSNEKAIRELFRNYRYAYAVFDNAPVLLMNEADGLLWQREENPDGAAARANNISQTLFLDEMDSFEGILIATTNMPQAFDKAIERRFLLKIQVGAPSMAARAQIWKSQLPFLSEQESFSLARRYSFTGGIISNIASRCDIYEVLHGERPSLERIRSYCELESGPLSGGSGDVMPVTVNSKNLS